jgi:hypothetical protein
VEIKKSTKLPDGVGKKIIEALKKQSDDSDFGFAEETQSYNKFQTSAAVQEKEPEYVSNSSRRETSENEELYSYSDEESEDFVQDDEEEIAYKEDDEILATEDFDYDEYYPQSYEEIEHATCDYSEVEEKQIIGKSKSYDIKTGSANVDTLVKLIGQLPSGVTKQTGAQIIRQTMEAMGISMNKVLTEAQHIQEELGLNIRNNINTIEEYRNNIRTLEKEVQSQRKKSEELEDLISLFLLSETKGSKK